jgi:hypothetical protein
MIRVVYICAITAASVAAQNAPAPPALATLQQTVQQRTVEWNRLAANLDATIIPLLPCDPKAVAAITRVTQASNARLSAMADYLEAAGRQAMLQTDAATKLPASEQAVAGDLGQEKSDLRAERAGVDGQIADLTQSGQNRSTFMGAQDTLKQVSTVEQQRSDALDSATSHAGPATAASRDLVSQLQARQAAWLDVLTAFESERTRWNTYYAARLARAQAECNVTKGPVSAPAPRTQGKQK